MWHDGMLLHIIARQLEQQALASRIEKDFHAPAGLYDFNPVFQRFFRPAAAELQSRLAPRASDD